MWLTLWLMGCEELETCERAASVDDPGLELGLGRNGFEEAIEDGDVLVPEWGMQGGRHLELAALSHGLNPGRSGPLGAKEIPLFSVELVSLDDDAIVAASQLMQFRAMKGDPELAELGLGDIFVAAPDDPERDWLLTVTAEDACGTTLTAERVVKLDMGGD